MLLKDELLEILINYASEGICVVDKNKKTIIYNKPMEQLEGLKISDVLNKKILEVFPGLDENSSTLCQVLNTGQPIIDRYQTYINKKGLTITSVNTTIPIKKNGEIVAAVEIAKDFTNIKELYDRIIRLNEKKIEPKEKNYYIFDNILGCSAIFLNSIEVARKASRTNSTVLIYGETGTGKEVFSRAIHNESKRKKMPFLAINCAALPETLLEGILFGTVKGGFTGALDRPGLFEQASGGTLLLDEINSMGVALQAKLLRVLQEGYVRRVGDVRDTQVDVRIIATTNKDPLTAIEEGNFRKDLYYRLSVVTLCLPPLRDRKEDVSLFVKEFINKYNNEFSKEIYDITSEVYDAFMSYEWKGNVRELKNYIEGAMNMSSGHLLKKDDFSQRVQSLLFKDEVTTIDKDKNQYDYQLSLDEYMKKMEKQIILKTMKKCNNNISLAAKSLKMKRQTLQHKLKKLATSY